MRRIPRTMEWLAAGVPITLIVDLLDPAGPNSRRVIETERRSAANETWVAALVANAAAQHQSYETLRDEARRDFGYSHRAR